MKKNNVIWVDRTLVLNPYYVGVCLTEDAFNNEMKRLSVPIIDRPKWISVGSDASTFELYNEKSKKCCCIVCISKNDVKNNTKEEIFGLLVHEAVHVWQKIRCNIGEDIPSSEFEAYAIQSLSMYLIDAFYKGVNVKKHKRIRKIK